MTSMDAATYQAASVPCRYISFIYYGYGLLLHVEYNGRIIYRFVQPMLSVCRHSRDQWNCFVLRS